MTQETYIKRAKAERRERELRENPLPPYGNYIRANGFLERLRRAARKIGADNYARLRKQALDGDLTGAERGLLEALWR